MDSRPLVLCVGRDDFLLILRSHALAKAGYRVRLAKSRAEAVLAVEEKVCDVAIICDSLGEPETIATAHAIEMVSPETRVLITQAAPGEAEDIAATIAALVDLVTRNRADRLRALRPRRA